MEILLGSQSPRRREILGYFSLPFKQVSSSFPEESVLFDGDPQAYCTAIAEGKAHALKNEHPQAAILTADTIVYQAGKVFGKPRDDKEAFESLCQLSGNWHSVFTAVTVLKGEAMYSAIEETRVLFNALTPQQIRHYQRQIHTADKAGGYAIQMAGGLIVNRIEGCYYNVMGLPINTLNRLLIRIGVDLWNYLPKS